SGSGQPLDPALYDLTYTYQDALGGAAQDKDAYDPDAVFGGAVPAPAGLYVVTDTLKDPAAGGAECSGTFVILIQKRSLEGANITLGIPAGGLVYNGAEQQPGVTSIAWDTLGGLNITAGDYAVTWQNNENAGQGYAVVSAATGS